MDMTNTIVPRRAQLGMYPWNGQRRCRECGRVQAAERYRRNARARRGQMMDISETIAPRSDQLNCEDLLSGPRTVTITAVSKGASAEQPVNITLAEFPDDRPFKPSKTVRRILVAAWGVDASAYIGRRMTIYRDPSVRFGGQDVGGIRVSHLSHIDKQLSIALTVTRGKRAPYVVQPLPDDTPPGKTFEQQITDCITHYDKTFNVTRAHLEAHVGAAHTDWTPPQLEQLRVLAKQLKAGEKNVADEFGADGPDDTLPGTT